MTEVQTSLLHRLRHTPMRDVVRGRMTGRLDFRHRLRRSALPPEISKAIETVVRRTRLHALEKADLAEELIAHFADGLEAGRSADDLVATFGDLRRTARLIRRAKIRSRPLILNILDWARRTALMMLLVYAAAWAWLITARADPTVDYLAEMNRAAIALPESERAWPLYREAFIRHEFAVADHGRLEPEETRRRKRWLAPGDGGWPAAVAHLSAHADLLESLRRGGTRKGMGLRAGYEADFQGNDRLALFGPDAPLSDDEACPDQPPDPYTRTLMGALIPVQALAREAATYLAVDLRHAVEENNAPIARRNLVAMLGLSRQSRELPSLVSELVSHRIYVAALEQVAYVLERRPDLFTKAQWIDLVHALAASDDDMHPDFSGERLVFLDCLQHMYGNRGRVTLRGVQMFDHPAVGLEAAGETALVAGFPLAAMLIADRDEAERVFERLYGWAAEDSRRPLWERLGKPSRYYRQIDEWDVSWRDKLRYWPLLVILPALDVATNVTQSTHAFREAIQVAIALHLYHVEHGRYPDELDDLVPRHLPAPPVDHSTGLPLVYRFVDGSPRLYGRGIDGHDDGGIMTDAARAQWPRVMVGTYEGDWVLYPPPMTR